jgi:hypothetical protein
VIRGRQLTLPSGAVIRVCSECERETPAHQYFCSAVRDYTRSAILREMVRVEDEVRRIDGLLAGKDEDLERDNLAAYGADGRSGSRVRTPLLRLASDHFLLRNEFWHWAWWLGHDFWAGTAEESRAGRADIRAEVEEMRQRINRRRLEDAAA